jgi:hypothetical protein
VRVVLPASENRRPFLTEFNVIEEIIGGPAESVPFDPWESKFVKVSIR